MSKIGAGITLPQVCRMQRDFDILKALTCIYMLTMRQQNHTEPARGRRNQRSRHHGLLWRRRRGLGILTGITCNWRKTVNQVTARGPRRSFIEKLNELDWKILKTLKI